jgi:hypothetical protein
MILGLPTGVHSPFSSDQFIETPRVDLCLWPTRLSHIRSVHISQLPFGVRRTM